MNRARILAALAATMLMTMSTSQAHPGHDGTQGDTLTHYVSQPQHAAIIGAGLLSLAGVAILKLMMARRKYS